MANFDLTNFTNLADRYTINTIPRSAIPLPANPTLSDLVRAVDPSIINNPYSYERAFSRYSPNYSAAGSSAIRATSPAEVPLLGYTPAPSSVPPNPYPFYTGSGDIAPNATRFPLVEYASPSVSTAEPARTPLLGYTPSPSVSAADAMSLSSRPVDPASTISPPRSVPGGTPKVSLGNIAKGTLGFLGLAAVADAVYNKDESALAYLLGMGPGSLVASTPLNAGEDEQLAFMQRQQEAEQAYQRELAQKAEQQQVASPKPQNSVDPDDLLKEAIKYRKLNNAIRRGAPLIEPQEEAQMVVQGAPEVKPENDMEVAPLDETPIRKSAGESTTPQSKNYITDGTKTTTFDKDKSLTKTSTSNPPANATTVPAPSKKNSSVTARQNNTTRQAQTSRTAQPVRNRTSRAPVQQRRVSPTLAEAVIYNRPDTLPVQTPVTRPNTNASGYTKGHEAVFNPRTGRLEFI